ncbi:MAG TPA: superinfection immunity protein [Stellaceae bacterium]|jgi:hypothetical protein|nr:superinfection immunity protein [Stellaceae bacterium]
MENVITVIMLILIVIIYMLPTLIAFARDIRPRRGVTILNIVLGWTLVGWLIAFFWASLTPTIPEDELA